MTVPAKMVAETLEIAREDGAAIRRKPNEIFDNPFVDNLEKSCGVARRLRMAKSGSKTSVMSLVFPPHPFSEYKRRRFSRRRNQSISQSSIVV